MRFLIDMPLSPQLAAWLVDEGHDAVHAAVIGLSMAPDTEIIGSVIVVERERVRRRRLPM